MAILSEYFDVQGLLELFWIAWVGMIGYSIYRVWFMSTQPREVRQEASRWVDDGTLPVNITLLTMQHMGLLDGVWDWAGNRPLRHVLVLLFFASTIMSASITLTAWFSRNSVIAS